MSKIQIHAFIIIVSSFLVSCATQSITVETPYKSEKELPEDIQSVLLISQVADETYSNLSSDSLQMIFYLNNFQYDTIIKELMTVDTILKVMGEILFESGRYDYIIPTNRFLRANKNSLLSGQLPWDDVKYLCKTYKTDALVSLDLLETSVQTDIKKDVSFYEVTNIGYITEDVEKANMKIKYKAHISVYNPLAKILTGYVLTDTLYWEDSDRSIIKLFEKFTPVKEALMETGIAIALDFADEITPNWERDKRDLFVRGDKRFREALLFIKNNELEKAVKILNEVLQQAESEKVQSEAEFNLALLYELQGDLDRAVEWAQKSYETMNRNNTYNYLEMLKERKINL